MPAFRRGPLKKMSANVGPNMTPMVDVVMCILIFIMLTTDFTTELFLSSNMAAIDKGGIGTEAGTRQLPSVVMTINLRRQGAGDAERTEVSAFDSAFMPMDSLAASPGARLEESPRNGQIMALLTAKRRTISDDVQVILLPDKRVPYQDVITIYDYCTKLQFKQVAFAAAR